MPQSGLPKVTYIDNPLEVLRIAMHVIEKVRGHYDDCVEWEKMVN